MRYYERIGNEGGNALAISGSTKELIQDVVSENTLGAYRRALLEMGRWISDAGNNFRLTER